MDKRPGEDHISFARRCVEAGRADATVTWQMSLPAGAIVAGRRD